MRNDSLTKGVVASLVASDDVHHELHHVVLDRPLLLFHAVDLLHATLNLSHDEFTRVAIYQDDPLVDEELLGLELDLDGLEHLNGLDDHCEGGLGHGCVVLLKQEQVDFEGALDLGSQLDAGRDLVRPDP